MSYEDFSKAPVRTLGRAIASDGHTLLQGYFNAFERAVAEAAFDVAKDSGKFPEPRLADSEQANLLALAEDLQQLRDDDSMLIFEVTVGEQALDEVAR